MSEENGRYKITKTTTGPDGKVHIETIEMIDKEALRVSFRFRNRSIDRNLCFS